jgi:hypothetical protein
MNSNILLILLVFGYSPNITTQNLLQTKIQPPFTKIVLPSNGFVSIDTVLDNSPCDTIPDSSWQTHAADSFNIFISTKGPSGSGRFWNVTIGLADTGQLIPNRGVCLYTSTIGWRTLQSFNKLPLPWIDDRDKNGKPEIIIWDSFPLYREATMSEFGLIAWVYEFYNNEFILNWKLSKERIAEIIKAYRNPIKGSDVKKTNQRKMIAKHLENLVLSQEYIY